MGLFGDIVDAVGDAAGAVGDAAEDALDAAVDGLDNAIDAVGDALGDIADVVEDIASSALDELGDLLGDALEAADDVFDAFADLADEAWDTGTDLVEGAVDAIGDAAEDVWEGIEAASTAAVEAIVDAAEASWDALESAAESTWEAVSDAAEEAWDGVEAAATAAWTAAETAYEWAVTASERALEYLGDLAGDIVDVLKQLGACLGGIIVHNLAEADNIVFNFGKPIRPLPAELADAARPLLGDIPYHKTFLMENAHLSGRYWSDTTDAMTFKNPTVPGLDFGYMVYVFASIDPSVPDDAALAVHELTHVRQYRDFAVEDAFACAYGIGFVESGFVYEEIPLEAEAFAIQNAFATS